MSQVDDDIVSNFSDNPTLTEVALSRISRRTVMGAGLASTALAVTGGITALLKAVPASAQDAERARRLLGFEGIATSIEDAVKVPRGYTARVLIAWGDPVSDGPEFRPDASNSAFEQEWQWGMHNDGLVYFPIEGSSHHGLHRPEPRVHRRRAAVSRRHRELEPGKDQQVTRGAWRRCH